MASSLVAHVDARLVSLDVLAAMAQPAPMGPRHRPLRHIDLVGAVREEVARRGLAILKERFAVGHHGATLFATFDLGVQLVIERAQVLLDQAEPPVDLLEHIAGSEFGSRGHDWNLSELIYHEYMQKPGQSEIP